MQEQEPKDLEEQRLERLTKGYAEARHRLLKEAFPKFLRELEAAGKLKWYLQELGRQAAEMREEVEGSMRAQAVKPGLGLSQSDLEERLRMIPQVADEIVDHDLILKPPSQT